MKRFTCLAALVLIAGLGSCHEEDDSTTTTVQASPETTTLHSLNYWEDSPTEYTYPSTYTTKVLSPTIANWMGAQSPSLLPDDTFSVVPTTFSGDRKYLGGVLAPNGKIYFVPYSADSVGVFTPGSAAPVYDVDGDIPLSWSALLGPRYNKF